MFSNVKVGQVWMDYDSRMRHDLFPSLKKIVDIKDGYAFVETTRGGRLISKSKIRLYRFKEHSRGYKLVHDVEQDVA